MKSPAQAVDAILSQISVKSVSRDKDLYKWRQTSQRDELLSERWRAASPARI